MDEIILYRWRAIDPTCPYTKGRWHALRWRMTETDAAEWCAAELGRQIERIEGSEEKCTPFCDADSVSKFQGKG